MTTIEGVYTFTCKSIIGAERYIAHWDAIRYIPMQKEVREDVVIDLGFLEHLDKETMGEGGVVK